MHHDDNKGGSTLQKRDTPYKMIVLDEIRSNQLSKSSQNVCFLSYEGSKLGVGGPPRLKIENLFVACF